MELTKIEQQEAQKDFLEVCSLKRLEFIVGKDKAENFLSDFLIVTSSIPEKYRNYKEIATCCVEIASLKLSILKQSGQAYVVPRDGKASVEIGYKGWLVLARRSGIAVKAYPVFKGDHFVYEVKGFSPYFEYRPSEENLIAKKTAEFVENNLVCIAVCTKDIKFNIDDTVIITRSLLNEIKSKGAEKSPAYRDWLLEMYMGKAIKYVIRKLALDREEQPIFKALSLDDKNDVHYEKIENSRNMGKNTAHNLGAFGANIGVAEDEIAAEVVQ